MEALSVALCVCVWMATRYLSAREDKRHERRMELLAARASAAEGDAIGRLTERITRLEQRSLR